MSTTNKSATNTRVDVYATVTNKVIAQLEAGVRPWLQPWSAGNTTERIVQPLRSNGEKYRGINILMLWGAAAEANYASPYWMTFQQAKELGGVVKKGEHGTPVVYASRFTKTETNDDGSEIDREIPFLKTYTVFNAEQVEGLPESYRVAPEHPLSAEQRIEQAETFFRNTKADVRHGGGRAYYTSSDDFIRMPPFESFRDAASYYSTLGHETVHWTKIESRLNRDFGRKRFGDAGYAREELVAELGAAFLCCDLGISPEPREDHAAYLDAWLGVLKEDKRALFQAAAYAQKAVDFLHSLQPNGTPQEPAADHQPESAAARSEGATD